MNQTVSGPASWQTFRDELRARLRSHLGQPLISGIRADAWTPEEVLHHVLLVDASAADLLERLVAKVKVLEPRDPLVEWPVRQELMDFPLDTAFSVPAFRGTEPKRGMSIPVLQSLEATVQERHRVLVEKGTRYRLDEVTFPHPLAGKMNFYEWLVFGGIHEGLHLTHLENDLSR